MAIYLSKAQFTLAISQLNSQWQYQSPILIGYIKAQFSLPIFKTQFSLATSKPSSRWQYLKPSSCWQYLKPNFHWQQIGRAHV